MTEHNLAAKVLDGLREIGEHRAGRLSRSSRVKGL